MNRSAAAPRGLGSGDPSLHAIIWRSASAAALALGALVGLGCQSSSAPGSPPPITTPPPVKSSSLAPLDCSSSDAGDWPMYGGNVCSSRSAPSSDPITPQTASRLEVKWAYDAAGDISATPAVAGGQVYVGDWGGMLERLDALTGRVVWSRSVADILGLSADGGADAATLDGALTDGPAGSEGVDDAGAEGGAADGSGLDAATLLDGGDAAATDATVDTSVADATLGDAAEGDAAPAIRGASGVVIRGTPAVTNGLVIFGVGTSSTIAAVDQDSGALVWHTALDTHPFAVITSSPTLDNGRIYIGVSSGEEGAPADNSRLRVLHLPGQRGRARRDERQDPLADPDDRRRHLP